MSNRTICLINDSFPPVTDGVANAVVNYGRAITESGDKAVVVTPAYPGADDSGFSFPVVRYPSIDMTKLVGYHAGFPFSEKTMQTLMEYPFDLIHCHCPITSAVLARELRARIHVPTVFTYHTKFDIDIANAIHAKLLQEGAKKLLARMEKLLEGADRGKIIREGLQTVIVGKPNVGKSSLLNWLLEEDRAIVTDIPGTTRDTVEEYLNIDGIPIKIVDTAGIRETGDVVEKMGVEKSKAYAETADLVIMMLDGSRPLEEEDKEILSFIRGKKTIVLLNKVDLAQKLSLEELAEYVPQEQILFISVKENDGFDALLDALKNMFLDGHTATAEDAMLGNTRHKDALYRAKEAMEHCMETITMRMPEDFISMDLQDANRALGEITGDTSDEEIIDRIFTKFCLGK